MNDMLRPELLWIEGRCYRVNDPITEVSTLQEHDIYENGKKYRYLFAKKYNKIIIIATSKFIIAHK